MDGRAYFFECPAVSRIALITICGIVSVAIAASAKDSNALSRLKRIAPCASLVASAQANRIPLEGIDPQTETNRMDRGDSISALITLFEKRGKPKQWLLYLEAVVPTAEESAQKPGRSMVLYSSFGGTQTCVAVPAFVVVRTLGPFVESANPDRLPKTSEKSARFSLNKGFLSLGLHHAAAAFHRFETGPVRGSWSVSHRPFSDEQLIEGRAAAERLKLTPEEERGIVGAIPALLSYFDVIKNTPGLSDIFYEIVDLPSAWSLLRNVGIKSVGLRFGKGMAPASAATWGLPETAPAYLFPLNLDLNDHPALNLTFVVTSPNPPLLASAGVVGLLAENPSGPEKYLTLRILSARLRKQ